MKQNYTFMDAKYVLDYFNRVLSDSRLSPRDRINIGKMLIHELDVPVMSKYNSVKEWSEDYTKWKIDSVFTNSKIDKIV